MLKLLNVLTRYFAIFISFSLNTSCLYIIPLSFPIRLACPEIVIIMIGHFLFPFKTDWILLTLEIWWKVLSNNFHFFSTQIMLWILVSYYNSKKKTENHTKNRIIVAIGFFALISWKYHKIVYHLACQEMFCAPIIFINILSEKRFFNFTV